MSLKSIWNFILYGNFRANKISLLCKDERIDRDMCSSELSLFDSDRVSRHLVKLMDIEKHKVKIGDSVFLPFGDHAAPNLYLLIIQGVKAFLFGEVKTVDKTTTWKWWEVIRVRHQDL